MSRINVFDGDSGELAGWFERSKAKCYEEETRWDGNNHISCATGNQWRHEKLYRTAGGRWVLHWWSNYGNEADRYRFISDEDAKQWLLAQHHDGAVEEYFGGLEEEAGPGRPEIGPAVHIRLTAGLLAQIDDLAADEGLSRAETIRALLTEALALS